MDDFKDKLSPVIKHALQAAADTVIREITQLLRNEFTELSERVEEMKELKLRLERSESELKQLRQYLKTAEKGSLTPSRVNSQERDSQFNRAAGDHAEKESADITGVNVSFFNRAKRGPAIEHSAPQRACTSQAAPSIKDWPLVLLITPEIVTEDNNQELLISDQSVDTWIRSIVDRAGLEKEAQEETGPDNIALQIPEQDLHQEYRAVQTEAPQVSVQSNDEVPLQGSSHSEEQGTEVEPVFITEGAGESAAAHVKEELPELESDRHSRAVPDMESVQMKEEITEERSNNNDGDDENDGSIHCKEEAHISKELSAGAHNESTALGSVRPEAPVHSNGQVYNDRSTDDTEKESSSVENLGSKDCEERAVISPTSVTCKYNKH
ncbi:uncharacterized protein LOC121304003 [Polyodon spathula]|uniref:uncharacterized protein LOC121304003 n=1 Tax=Polyodon spathula TaxID=7913 RepID=UPI001B7EB253|nr:uncharacterized protein LOC121304003 [Polyodon spathula]